jgi:dTDP-4-dehydrorhamnose 3,5-epimerase
MSDKLAVTKTNIDGLFVIDLVLYGDNRGWFKESYQQQKMEALGLPHFEVVQNNFSFNTEKGATRGLHAEPWEKFISLANGSVFGAWVDLRPGNGFGQVFTTELTPDKAIFVPRGIANGYQTLEDNVTYTYLVNAHWSPEVKYVAVNLFDPALDIKWPLSQEQAIVSDKDKLNPMLKDIEQL